MKSRIRFLTVKRYAELKVIKSILVAFLLIWVCHPVVLGQTVTDNDGNVYNTVTIGTQVWMVENLKTTKFNDDVSILNSYTYKNTTNVDTINIFGRLYIWPTVNTGKLCPAGWHVPGDAEWTALATYLGGISIAGAKLKETGTTHWTSPNTGATNESGFTALPGGYRFVDGLFYNIGYNGSWWSSTEDPAQVGRGAWMWFINNSGINISRVSYGFANGLSVRCMKDIATGITENLSSFIVIYPNPVSGILNIDYKSEYFETVSVLNSQGGLLAKEKAISLRQQIDFSAYSPGLYFLEFVTALGETKRIKVINQ